jgi:hypothetical protein
MPGAQAGFQITLIRQVDQPIHYDGVFSCQIGIRSATASNAWDIGGVAGAVMGAYEPIQEQEQSVARCLSEKGYVLGS